MDVYNWFSTTNLKQLLPPLQSTHYMRWKKEALLGPSNASSSCAPRCSRILIKLIKCQESRHYVVLIVRGIKLFKHGKCLCYPFFPHENDMRHPVPTYYHCIFFKCYTVGKVTTPNFNYFLKLVTTNSCLKWTPTIHKSLWLVLKTLVFNTLKFFSLFMWCSINAFL